LFTVSGEGVAAAVVQRGSAVQPAFRCDDRGRCAPVPIDLGSAADPIYLILFGTGLRLCGGAAAVSVAIGGGTQEVVFAGPQGGFAGLDQVNVRLSPSLAGRGEVDVVVAAGGRRSNPARISIR